jgi:hypothetical protein
VLFEAGLQQKDLQNGILKNYKISNSSSFVALLLPKENPEPNVETPYEWTKAFSIKSLEDIDRRFFLRMKKNKLFYNRVSSRLDVTKLQSKVQ